ncbi:phage portal protein [uncultured Megasphaera sp.]|uniref:phage portal protein n=1 Tax=uncultured Megasphaera sp. TaxID=165188 RepID=UPI00286911DB|nr:phage portal protein [uncultured Megasphaera sp.]
MRIQTTKTALSVQDLARICLRHDRYYNHCLKLKGYYAGQHDILHKEARNNGAPNNKVVANFCKYISDMDTGFFIGKPVAYASFTGNGDEVQTLQDVFKYNDEPAHNMELAEEASITGDGYELLYMDADANIRFRRIPSEEVILVCDASLEENVMLGIRHYRVYDLDGTTYQEYVDVYDDSTVTNYSYDSGTLRLISAPQPHFFSDVPIVEYANNQLHQGDFEGVITQIDAYNLAQSCTMDDMEDFTDAYLCLAGMGGTTGEDVQEMRRNKVLLLDNTGDAKWLIKNLNDTYIENMKSRLEKDIHKFSSVPDMSDEAFSGNASGVAIKYKLIGMEQIRSRKEVAFRKGLQRRIELIADMLRTKSAADIDFRDIEITFTANIPADIKEQADIVKELYGLVSQKRLLSLLPFITDPAAEMDELKREEADRQDAYGSDVTNDERGVLGSPDDGAGETVE